MLRGSVRVAQGIQARRTCIMVQRSVSSFKGAYDKHVADRLATGVVPLPLNAAQTADLVAQLKVFFRAPSPRRLLSIV